MAHDAQAKPVVVVTGGSGFIGSHLVPALANSYRVVALDIRPLTIRPPGVQWIECDLTSDASVAQALAVIANEHGERLASVIHLAAYYDFTGERNVLYDDLNIQGTRRLLRELQQYEVEQFVFASSLLVMKTAEKDELLTEESPVEAEWEYPRSKLEAEAAIRAKHGKIPTVILRIAGVYDDECHAIPLAEQIARIYEQKCEGYFFPGDAHRGQSFVHIEDLLDCSLLVVENRAKLPEEEVFLVGESDVISYAQLQSLLGELIHGQAWPTIEIPKIMAKAGLRVQEAIQNEQPFIRPWMVDLAGANYPIDNSKARSVLGWNPKHLLRNTLSKMIEDLKRNPRRWYQSNHLSPPRSLVPAKFIP